MVQFKLTESKSRKILIYILGTSLQPKYFLTIQPINVKDSDQVELLGINIDKHLSFKKHIENVRRITNCISLAHKQYLTAEKAKILGNVFIDSQFNYALLIWMFCQNRRRFT